jgi:hypothetical protein
MKQYVSLLMLGLIFCAANAQVYIEKQTRHRFAQMHLGADVQMSFGGKTHFLNVDGGISQMDLNSVVKPRFVIGGTHFWGHADFYLAIPLLNPIIKKNNQEIAVNSGVETVFKYYPWRIKDKKLRLFVGVSIAPFYFEQTNGNLAFGNGPELNHTSLPVLAGVTFNHKNHLFEAGVTWNYLSEQRYFIDRNVQANITMPPLFLNVAYHFMMETTLGAEKDWESGRTKQVTEKLAAEGKLSNFYLAAGMSSAFWLQNGTYNQKQHPFVETYSTSLMPEFGFGYYWHKPDMNFNVMYRGYKSGTNTYGLVQSAQRQSAGFEVTKCLFDFHGFDPFVGPVLSVERLRFNESFVGNLTHDLEEDKLAVGITFGWDIRPNRIQSWILRTNLRWYPQLNLDVPNKGKVAFSNIEFNFIELVVYPGRMF